jgi:hypothetical protein
LTVRAERVTLGLLALTAASVGFERLDPSLGLTADLRLTNLRLVAALALIAWLSTCALNRRWPDVPRPVGWLVAVWLGLLVVSAALAPIYQTQALAFTRDMVFCAAVGWAVYDVACNPTRQTLIARALALCGMAIGVIAVAEATGVQPVVEWLAGFRNQATFGVGELPRVASTLPHPNVAAMLLGLSLPLQVAWIVTVSQRWARIALGVGIALSLVALVLTVSRAGMLVVEVVLGGMLLIGLRQQQRKLIVTSLSAVVLLPVLLGLASLREPLMRLHLTSENVAGWYRADYSPPASISAIPGQTASVDVRLHNIGDRTWDASGPHPFALSYHLEDASGEPVTYDGLRTPLPVDVAPGTAVDLQAQILAPTSQGSYVVEWDGVQEAVTWFSWTGTPVARSSLNVAGSPASEPTTAVTELTQPPVGLQPPPPSRLTQWRIALRMARHSPLLGVGPDNFRWVYGDFAEVTTWDIGSHANSLYFEWLADTGLPALCIFLLVGWQLLRRSWSGLQHPSGPFWTWRLALAASLTAWFLHGVFDYFYEPLPTNLAFWLVAGLALGAARPAWQPRRQERWNTAECGSPST